MSDQERLAEFIRGRHPCISIITVEENYALSLIHEVILRMPKALRLWSIIGGVRDGLLPEQPPVPETEHPAAALYHLNKHDGESIVVMLDLAPHLKDERTLRIFRDYVETCRIKSGQIILIDHDDTLPTVIRGVATRFEIALPDEQELEKIVRATLREMNAQGRLDVEIPRTVFQTLIRNLSGLRRGQVKDIIIETVATDHRFDATDLNTVVARKRQFLQSDGLLEFIESPVDLASLGGMKRLKNWLVQRENIFTDEASAFGLRPPRGVLLLGVQGAGKSFCAKAIATAWKRPLLRMDVGSLYDRYVGESEHRLRDTLRQAEAMAPMILWIDEIEKAFASAASRSNDGGLSQRMFGMLLTWMQEHREPVFLVATANDIEALPPELLRKGRFDEIFFVDLPDKQTRRDIFSIHLKKNNREPAKFNLDLLADTSDGYSGAEIEQAIFSAMYDVFAAKRDLDAESIRQALAASPPLSVTQAERIAELREWAKGRCVPAD